MQAECRSCGAGFRIEAEDLEFYARISPRSGDKSFMVPPPTLCPDCRFQRRAVWRNEFRYYSRTCPLCGHRSISVHSEQKPYPVYCNRCWWSDRVDLREFGLEIDLSQPFFEQFSRLQARCPKPFMANDNHTFSENIEYCQGTAYSKNCYIVTTSWRLQDSLYCSNCGESRDLVDCRFVGDQSELIYESATCQRCYSCSFLYGCSGCSDCHLGIDLRGCADCVACVGLRNKRYHIFNQPFPVQEYARQVERLQLGSFVSREEVARKFEQFAAQRPQRGVLQVNCVQSSGNNLFNCKQFTGFNVWGGEDCKYYVIGTRPRNCYDILVGGEHQWCYEGVNPDHSYMSHFTVWCWSCTDVHYSDNCHSSKNLFGCIGLRGGAQFCILNKQYTADEYQLLLPKIIESMQQRGEWGEFFPLSTSPFAYNETIAQDYFPLSFQEAQSRGLLMNPDEQRPEGEPEYSPPDHIDDVPDAVTGELLLCGSCRRNYKVMRLELAFYRKMRLPVPRTCPDCRRKSRFGRSGGFKVFPAVCRRCSAPMESAAAAGAQTDVLCGQCYENAIFS